MTRADGNAEPVGAFGERLRHRRVASLITQESLADIAGVSVRTIRNIESGRTAHPHPSTQRQIEDALAQHQATTAVRDSGKATVDAQADPVIPRQVPASVRHFVGRVAELATLSDLADQAIGAGGTGGGAAVISAISGPAGVGKTALVLEFAHRAAGRFPGGQLYVNLRGFDPSGTPVRPAEAIRGLLDAFHVPASRVPAAVDTQAALFRSLVAGRRMLLVLDNAREADQVRPLLPGGPGCLTLVTSRDQLVSLVAAEDAHLLTLDVLTNADARDLLDRRLGPDRVTGGSAAVDDLVTLSARLPLALAIIAARVAASPSLSPDALVESLRDARGRLDALDAGDAATSIRLIFSWSYRNLGAPARRAFRRLGIHPGPDIGAAGLASLAGVHPDRARAVLTELTRANLIVEHRPGRYTFHDLLRIYAAERARSEESPAQRHAALRRLLDYQLHTAVSAARRLSPARPTITVGPLAPAATADTIDTETQALAWFTAEHTNLLAAVESAAANGFDHHVGQLAWSMTDYLDRQGHWSDWIAVQQAAVAAAQRLGDLVALAAAHRSLGAAAIQLGHYEDAHVHLARTLEVRERLADRTGQGWVHLAIGRVYDQQGKHLAALDHARQALHLFQAADEPHRQAIAYNAVGWCHTQLGDYPEALACSQKALDLFDQLGDRHSAAEAWDSAGMAHHRLGDHADAIACFQRALELFDVSDSGSWSRAQTLGHLGDARQAIGERDLARAAWHQALVLLDDLHHPDVAIFRAKLGDPAS